MLLKTLKTACWLTVGVTAIAIETTSKGVKHVHNEVKQGRPQKLVHYHCHKAKKAFSKAEKEENIIDSFLNRFSTS